MSLNILLVEGNNSDDSSIFVKVAGATAANNLKNLVLKLEPSSKTKIINPANDNETNEVLKNINKYHGIIFTGGAMRINDMTDEIKKHINFASNCFQHNKIILAICWGLQVCSAAAGVKVEPAKNGAHIGIATDVMINEQGQNNLIYKNKKTIFTTPAFNYDEVVTLPNNAILLSSNKVNNVMALNFETEFSKIWGIQYHPEITYEKMITLIKFRRKRLLENKSFSDEKDLESHITMIENEDKITKKESRMRELKNWLDLIA